MPAQLFAAAATRKSNGGYAREARTASTVKLSNVPK